MKDKSVEKLYIYNNHLDLVFYSYNILKKFPKYEKDSLHSEIRNILLSIYKNILSAYEQSNNILKVGILKEMKTNIKVLELYIRIAYKEKYISSQNYAAWSRKVFNVNKHLGNWLLSCQKKLK